MNSLRVSVVIPTYDRPARMLRAAIDSVLNQDLESLEVIVVDDGSGERATPIAASYGEHVRYHFQSNRGMSSARNTGIDLSRGQLLAFLDSDDLWVRNKLRRQLASLEADPDLEAVFGRAEQFYDDEVDEEFRRRHPIKNSVMDAWLSSAMLIRKEAFARVGGFDETIRTGVDLDWFLRATEAGLRREMLPLIVFRRRIHGANISITEPSGGNRERIFALKRSLDRRRAAAGATDPAAPRPG